MASVTVTSLFSLHAATAAELTEGDLVTVLNEIYEARVRAHFVGLNLKISTDVLESIKTRYDDDGERLYYVIFEFLKRLDPKPTWRAIVDALKSATVNMAKLAEKIEAKFCSPPKPDTGKGMQYCTNTRHWPHCQAYAMIIDNIANASNKLHHAMM